LVFQPEKLRFGFVIPVPEFKLNVRDAEPVVTTAVGAVATAPFEL
jgi:hypothetical protein